MGMNTGSSSSLQSEINITPLVDVVLVLLIIFMVIIPLLMEGYEVKFRRAPAANVAAQAEESQLVLTVGPKSCRLIGPPTEEGLPADCQVALADKWIPAAEVPTRVAEILGSRPSENRVLFLAADDGLNYEGVL